MWDKHFKCYVLSLINSHSLPGHSKHSMLESNSWIQKLHADQFLPCPVDMQMVNVLQATCYKLHAMCYKLHDDQFSPCPVDMQMVNVLQATCSMLQATSYMLISSLDFHLVQSTCRLSMCCKAPDITRSGITSTSLLTT